PDSQRAAQGIPEGGVVLCDARREVFVRPGPRPGGGAVNHQTKCMREACRAMGCELYSIQQFVMNSIEWLANRGDVEILAEEGDYLVNVTGKKAGVSSYGHSLGEALCGAVHAILEAGAAGEG